MLQVYLKSSGNCNLSCWPTENLVGCSLNHLRVVVTGQFDGPTCRQYQWAMYGLSGTVFLPDWSHPNYLITCFLLLIGVVYLEHAILLLYWAQLPWHPHIYSHVSQSYGYNYLAIATLHIILGAGPNCMLKFFFNCLLHTWIHNPFSIFLSPI